MNKIKCNNCGQFISYLDIPNGNAIPIYTPDTLFTVENIIWIHKKHKDE